MRKDVCFVCVGQCAGNIGSLLEKKGYSVLFINTAESDLALLQKAKHVFKVPGERGCNQDPEKAQGVFAQHYKAIMDKIHSFARERIVYFVSSASGGTSGMTPLMIDSYLEVLEQEENDAWAKYDADYDSGNTTAKAPEKRKAGFITVLPALDESIVLNANAYNYMRQISETIDRELGRQNSNLANGFLIDNENCKDFLKLNQDFVDLFDSFMKIPEKHKSVRGNIDAADLEDAVTTIGITVFSEVSPHDFSESSLVNAVKSSKVFAQTESDNGRFWLSSTTDELDSSALEIELGTPITYFKTFNDYTNLFAISGLGIPAERINLMADRAEEYRVKEVKRNSDVFKRGINVRQIPKVAPPRVLRDAQHSESDKRVVTPSGLADRTSQNGAEPSVQDKLNMLRRRRAR